MMADSIQTWLYTGHASIFALMAGIVLLSYLLEDLAIITAAVLASEAILPATFALVAIFIGISSGDLGLYLIGKGAKKIRWLRWRLFRHRKWRQVKSSLKNRAMVSLFIVRFVPGLRTMGFTLSGFIDVPIWRFLTAVIAATALWTLVIFSSFYQLGTLYWTQQNNLTWVMVPVGVFIMWLINRAISKRWFRGSYEEKQQY